MAACAGAVVLLSGATTPPLHIRSIGIIAALGDTCMFEHVQDTDFAWIAPPGADFLEISEWGIDDAVTNLLTKQLGARYRVQSIAIEHQDFDSWTYASLARRVRELPIPETSVDAYLLVLRDWHDDTIGNTDEQMGGLGLYRRDAHRGGGRYGAYAAYRLVLLEANNGALIADNPALLTGGRLPWFAISPHLWPRTPNDLTNVQARELKRDFMALIDSTLPPGLQSLGLVSPAPRSAHAGR